MANNTLGEWSDGEDDWIWEIDESVFLPSTLEEWSNDELIRNIDEGAVLRGLNDEPIPDMKDKGGTSCEEDEQETSNSEDDELIPDSEDDDSIPGDEDTEQTGRGVKRKAQNQNEEQEQDYYQIEPGIKHHSKKFKMVAKNYSVHFNNALGDVDLLQSRNRTYGIFGRLIEDLTEGMNPADQVRFVLQSDQLQFPISIPFCRLEELTVEKVLSNVEKVVQSNEDFRLNDTVTINIIHVEMPRGSGRRKRTTLNIRDHLKKKRSVILINNKDNLCLARALVVSIARIEKDRRFKQIREARGNIQTQRALDLHQAANVPLGPCGIDKVKLFQHYLVQYQIIVVSGDQDNAIIYPPQPPANPNPEKSIYLYYQDNHFDVITTLPGFLNTNYFCHRCHKAYDHATDHFCKGMCRSCRGFDCVIQDNGMVCHECDRLFKNQACYDRHKQQPINTGGRTVCQTIRKCPKCKQSMDVRKIGKPHQCVDKKCPTCKKERNPQDLTHRCYMQQVEPMEETSYNQLLFFDFERTQEHDIHEVNLCVACDESGEAVVFQGKNTVKDFCTWLFTPEHHECIVIAHNFQGYDSYPILKFLNENTIPCTVIYNGTKCMMLETKTKKAHRYGIRIKFIDSSNFIPMALAKFPKTFAQPELFRHEILKYCRSDVDILARCCKLYRGMLMEATDTGNDGTGIDPFDTATTLAGYCMQVYRTKFLQKDTIALLPRRQELKGKQSHEALPLQPRDAFFGGRTNAAKLLHECQGDEKIK